MMGSWINAMADPDLQIRMGVGGGPPGPSSGSATVIVMQLFTSTVKGLNPGVILKIA